MGNLLCTLLETKLFVHFFPTSQCSSNCNHVEKKKKKAGFLAGSSKWHPIMRWMFISSSFQKSYAKTVYFREILLRFFYWLSTLLVCTLIQENSPWKGDNILKRFTLIRFWKKKCTNISVFVFRMRGRHISMVLFGETCDQIFYSFSILWGGEEGWLNFRLTLITKKITGLRLMAWKTLDHNFRFCPGLRHNLDNLHAFFLWVEWRATNAIPRSFLICQSQGLLPVICLLSKKNPFE